MTFTLEKIIISGVKCQTTGRSCCIACNTSNSLAPMQVLSLVFSVTPFKIDQNKYQNRSIV